jgi:hypothetical protein
MEKLFFRRRESNRRQALGIAASLKLFHGYLKWLADLFHLTEEERMDAGIYLGEKRNE